MTDLTPMEALETIVRALDDISSWADFDALHGAAQAILAHVAAPEPKQRQGSSGDTPADLTPPEQARSSRLRSGMGLPEVAAPEPSEAFAMVTCPYCGGVAPCTIKGERPVPPDALREAITRFADWWSEQPEVAIDDEVIDRYVRAVLAGPQEG
jgi:hypothetical protein